MPWCIQANGTSMGRDWVLHYTDTYTDTFEKEALYEAALEPHTCYRYLDDIFMVLAHGEKA